MYKKGHIHFVGIGGIGMSGIAKIMRSTGYKVSGCDLDHNQKSIIDLKNLGCLIYRGNDTPDCQDESIDTLVYSSAISDHNQEIMNARKRGIPTIPRALMLAEIMRTKFSIAVTGAHGKTTVTSLIAHILMEAQHDPTVIVGGHLQNISSNARLGKGEFVVVEADESDRSFLRLYPTIAVVTNIDLEHLETYTDLEDIKASFLKFISHVPFYGKAILCADDDNIRSLLPQHHIKTLLYGIDHEADLYAQEILLEKEYSTCLVYKKGKAQPLGPLMLTMPGRHNVLNALAALTTAMEVGISFEEAAQALRNFKGIDRRFTNKGTFQGATLIDDYGHHPTEIFNTLQVARKRTSNRLIVVFQPHRYSRTEKLWDDFVNLFVRSSIDELIFTDIYPASEAPRPGITAENLAQAIQKKNPSFPVHYMPYEKEWTHIISHLKKNVNKDDLVLLQGAGKVNTIADMLQSF